MDPDARLHAVDAQFPRSRPVNNLIGDSRQHGVGGVPGVRLVIDLILVEI